MANGFIALSGSKPVEGQYNPDSASSLWKNRTRIFYVWDTAVGSAFTASQFGDLLTGGFALTGGLWRLRLQLTRAAMASETATTIAISVNSGDTTTDHVLGRNVLPLGETAAAVASGVVEDLVYSAVAFTIYAKAKQVGGTSASNYTGTFMAYKEADV